MNSPRINSLLARVRWPRMFDWLLYAALLSYGVLLLAPQQLPVSLYKLSLVALAGVAGYWIDRSLFPYARPDLFLSLEAFEDDESITVDGPDGTRTELEAQPDDALLRLMGVCMLRRAIIVAAAMLAMGLGA